MELLQQLQTQVVAIWKRWDASQRIGFAIAALLCLIGVGLIGSWATQQEFVALDRNLSIQESNEIISALESEGIEFQQNQAGSMVLVPVGQLADARRAAGQYLSPAAVEEGPSIGGMWMDPDEKKSLSQRAQERRLAASITRMRSIKTAIVHISQGHDSPFLREQKPAKASVVLELVPGGMFGGTDAQAIISLVSHSVQNLTEDNTMIVDTTGRVLSSSGQPMADIAGQLAFRKQLETHLSQKARSTLAPLLGYNKASVQVFADLDFTEKTTARKSFDPDEKVKKSETITSESTTGAASLNGAAGTASNVGNAATQASGTGSSTDSETITTEYGNTEINDTIKEAAGAIQRITVSATIELPVAPAEGEEGADSFVPITTEQIQKLIEQAVGFDASRGDEITVVAGKFIDTLELVEPSGFAGMPSDLESLLRSGSLGIAAIVALVIGWMTVKKLKPVVVEVDRRKSLSPEVRERLATLADEIRERPDAMSTVLTTWMGGSEGQEDKQKRKVA